MIIGNDRLIIARNFSNIQSYNGGKNNKFLFQKITKEEEVRSHPFNCTVEENLTQSDFSKITVEELSELYFMFKQNEFEPKEFSRDS